MRKVSYIDEYELLCLVATGNQDAFSSLFTQFRNKVYSFAFHYTHSTSISEEITQEVFMKLWIKRETIASISNIESWIMTVTKNLCFNQLKRKALELRVKNLLSDAEYESADNVEDYMAYKDQLNNLHHALEKLSPQQRAIYTLNRESGLKNEEIALQLNLSTSTVKNHLVLALRKIRIFMEAHPTGVLLLMALLFKNIFR